MALYEELLAQCEGGMTVHDKTWVKGAFKAFWDTWWKVLQEYLPEEDSWERDETPGEASKRLPAEEMVEGIPPCTEIHGAWWVLAKDVRRLRLSFK